MIRCSACAAPNPDAMRYCGHCGNPLTATSQRLDATERRQVTVVFCDLVASTQLSQLLDPEDLADVLIEYRRVVVGAAAGFGGTVVRFIGDGVLLCFGYPIAHERDSLRAVRCALEVVERVRRLTIPCLDRADWRPSVRIGVHTGLTLVGELGEGKASEANAFVGETPNIASRIQAEAGPHGIYISAATQRLVDAEIECRPLGAVRLKGTQEPIDLFEVMGPRPDSDDPLRFHGSSPAPPIGREVEFGLAVGRWALACGGEGQIGIAVADAGLGKTRLARALAAHAAAGEARVLVAACTSDTAGSVFHSIAVMLRRELGQRRFAQPAEATPSDAPRRNDVEGLVGFGALSRLLGIGGESTVQAPTPTVKERQQSFAEIAAWIASAPDGRPTLFVVEDVHWADPSTLEFLAMLPDHIARTPCFVLMTARPQFDPPWRLRSNVFSIHLGRLPDSAASRIVHEFAGRHPLGADTVQEIVARSNGVPLFIEEMTRALIETWRHGDDAGLPVVGAPRQSIPSALQETLLWRLDRLGEARPLVQICSCLGSDFGKMLLPRLWAGSADDLPRLVQRLLDSEILVQRGLGDGTRYSFRHTLIREAAYESLTRADRRRLHRRVAELLATSFADVVEDQPELLASHCAAGGLAAAAIEHWRSAYRRAYARSGYLEGVAFLRLARDEIANLPVEQRDRTEVAVLVDLGTALIATHGEGSPEVEEAFARVEALLRGRADLGTSFASLRGLQSFHQVRGPLDASRRLAERLLTLADAAQDPVAWVEARRRLGWCLFCMGHLERGRELLTAAIQHYQPSLASLHITEHSVDPAVLAHVNLAWLEAFAGRRARSIEEAAQGVTYARALDHGLSLAYALGMTSAVQQTLGDVGAALSYAAEAIALAENRRLPYWQSFASIVHGWAVAVRDGSFDADAVAAAIAAYRQSGNRLFVAYGLSLQADIGIRGDSLAAAAAVLQAARHSVAEVQSAFILPELLRLAAALEMRRSGANSDAAGQYLRAAVAKAVSAGMLLVAENTVALAESAGSSHAPDLRRSLAGHGKVTS